MEQRKQLWRSENYSTCRDHWPKEGRVILAQYDEEHDAVCLYQAFNAEIARYAVEHQRFTGCPQYNATRMTWAKPGFLWMMFRSNWGRKPNQTNVLAIWVKREAFERYLAAARSRGPKQLNGINVRVQWDPDHGYRGQPHNTRRAVQLGLKHLHTFQSGTDLVRIEDISDFVHAQARVADAGNEDALEVARERVYEVQNKEAMSIYDA